MFYSVQCPVGNVSSALTHHINKPAVCSGNGRCVSLRDATRFQTFNSYLNQSEYTGWDADKIHGCVCETGYEGVACEKRSCPMGSDPLTTSSSDLLQNEVQLIDCLCSTCQGGLYITFKGQQSPLIPFNASEDLIQYRFNVRISILPV